MSCLLLLFKQKTLPNFSTDLCIRILKVIEIQKYLKIPAMSATSNFLKKGSGAKYIINRPYTANCAKRVANFYLSTKSIHGILFVLGRPAILHSITAAEHGSVRA
jgi:hypothetical protein